MYFWELQFKIQFHFKAFNSIKKASDFIGHNGAQFQSVSTVKRAPTTNNFDPTHSHNLPPFCKERREILAECEGIIDIRLCNFFTLLLHYQLKFNFNRQKKRCRVVLMISR